MSGAAAAAALAKTKGLMKVLHGPVTKISDDGTFCFMSPDGSAGTDVYIGSEVECISLSCNIV